MATKANTATERIEVRMKAFLKQLHEGEWHFAGAAMQRKNAAQLAHMVEMVD